MNSEIKTISKMENKTRTEVILNVMNVLAWIAFIGLLIESGAILFTYIMSCINQETSMDLYKGLDMFDLRSKDFWMYTQSVSFLIAIPAMKAYLVYLLIKIFSKIKLMNPFKMEIALTIEKISYVLFGIWIVSILSSVNSKWMLKWTGEYFGNGILNEYLFMAGLVFIISQIFKRGVELQSENELTV
ncbi:MAG: DUF2975 domain-containing protein [Ignavibacteria bacterium]